MNATTASLQRLLTASAFAVLAMGLSTTSHADEIIQDRIIEFSGPDASTAQGAGALYQRIGQAAREMCSVVDHGDLPSKRNFRSCVQRLTGDAVAQVHRPALYAVYLSNYPSPLPVEVVAAQNR